MPIANCLIKREILTRVIDKDESPIALWVKESRQPAEHMTITFTEIAEQFGNQYDVIATLYLPSLWLEKGSRKKVDLLQEGLALALAKYFTISIDDVQVITRLVNSGEVVESGVLVEW